jgi:hypothetical protein
MRKLPLIAFIVFINKKPGIPEFFPSVARLSFINIRTRCFPPPPYEGFGLIGDMLNYFICKVILHMMFMFVKVFL